MLYFWPLLTFAMGLLVGVGLSYVRGIAITKIIEADKKIADVYYKHALKHFEDIRDTVSLGVVTQNDKNIENDDFDSDNNDDDNKNNFGDNDEDQDWDKIKKSLPDKM